MPCAMVIATKGIAKRLEERILWRSIQGSIERKRNSKTSMNLFLNRIAPVATADDQTTISIEV